MSMFISSSSNTTDSFEVLDPKSEIANTKGPLLVDFFASWCGPCKIMSPIIKEIHEKYGDDLKIIKVDIEKHPDLANEYGISSIPSLLFFSEGKLIETKVGAMPKEGLVNWIDSELLADNDFDEQLKKDDSKSE